MRVIHAPEIEIIDPYFNFISLAILVSMTYYTGCIKRSRVVMPVARVFHLQVTGDLSFKVRETGSSSSSLFPLVQSIYFCRHLSTIRKLVSQYSSQHERFTRLYFALPSR